MYIKRGTGEGRELILIEREWTFFKDLVSLRISELKTELADLEREKATAIGRAFEQEIKSCEAVQTLMEKSDSGNGSEQGFPFGDR